MLGSVLGACFVQAPLAKTQLSLHSVVMLHELGIKVEVSQSPGQLREDRSLNCHLSHYILYGSILQHLLTSPCSQFRRGSAGGVGHVP